MNTKRRLVLTKYLKVLHWLNIVTIQFSSLKHDQAYGDGDVVVLKRSVDRVETVGAMNS